MTRIVNIAGTGTFQKLDLGGSYTTFKVQARTAVDIQVRFPGETDYWTLKSGTSESFGGNLGKLGLEVQAGNGVVVEVLLGFGGRDLL